MAALWIESTLAGSEYSSMYLDTDQSDRPQNFVRTFSVDGAHQHRIL